MKELAKILGPMRILLYSVLAVFLPMSLGADSEPEGIGVLYAYIAPSLIVLFLFVLLLDALMSRVFMVEKNAEENRPHRIRLRADLLAVAAILLFWGPYFYGLVALYSD
jgi:hypothetical protein